MTRVAWFHPFSGAAGDMTLAALLDAGADAAAVEAACRRVVPDGWSLRTSEVLRGGLRGRHVDVVLDDHGHHHDHGQQHEHHHEHRDAAGIIARIGAAGLPDRAAARAVATFERLAVAEGRLHGVDPAQVTFHEVGAVDSIVDVVGVCVALELLDVDVVASAPLTVGRGTIHAAHGVLPNPPPAVVEVLADVPVVGLDLGVELTTPTGAALLGTLAAGRFGAMPAMTVRTQGWGAGTKDLPGRANLLQVVLGDLIEAPTAAPTDGRIETVMELSTTIDDVRGEVVGHVVAEALAAGALDVWSVAATMKKGRPGVVLTVLAAPADADRLRRLVATETGTLGIRMNAVQRWVAERRVVDVTVDGLRVRVKVGPFRAKVEHDDAVEVARATGRPLQDVVALVERAYATGSAEASFRQSER